MKCWTNALLEKKEKKMVAEQATVIATATATATATTTDANDVNYVNDTPNAIATADRILAKALTDLSLNDRTAIEDEIYGVTCMAVKETPYLLELSLINFELELNKNTKTSL